MSTQAVNIPRGIDPGAAARAFPFFVGRGRSGTTLLLAMFDSRSDMAIPYESHFPVRMGRDRARYEAGGFDAGGFLQHLEGADGFTSWNLPIDRVRAEFDMVRPSSLPDALRAVYAAYARFHDKTRYGEKSPGFVMHIPLLAGMFPESRFVHIIRDGRDVSLSYLAAEWATNDLAEAAYYWRRFVLAGIEAGKRLGPERYHEVHYRDLVAEPERVLRSLCAFLDLPFEDAMLRYYERADSVLGKVDGTWAGAHTNLRKPPTKGLRDWRAEMSRDDQLMFDVIAGDLLEQLGYARAAERIPLSSRVEARRRLALVHARRGRRRLAKEIAT